ncbi:WD40/YVTN/BNR-like repeat-containing protein [Stutzerimonas stutzeri]|uniref:WD40/YVTN/BNR-like repeat-containing protein n=1 Tax=Stutzerimonas stutzeri TaxID=316 RepID=UPI003710C83F
MIFPLPLAVPNDSSASITRFFGKWPSVMLLVLLLPFGVEASVAAERLDPLREPSKPISAPAPLLGMARAGDVLVGVGLHGMIKRSTDGGTTWQQVQSPVSTDLVQVRFRDPMNGWIVGHDSVLLHTTDGGLTWSVQLDGRTVLARLKAFYGERAERGIEGAADMLQEVEFAMNTSATPDVLASPFLDVMFNEDKVGYVIGAFGMILRSTDDGATWDPWIEQTDNTRRMHLYGLDERDGVFYIAGEQGLLMRLNLQTQQFTSIETPYNGTYFGVRALPNLLLAYGLRGNLYASRDDGQQWQQIDTGLNASLISAVGSGQQLIMVSQSGAMIALDKQSLSVTPLQASRVGEVFAASGTGRDGEIVVTFFSGAKLVEIAKAN